MDDDLGHFFYSLTGQLPLDVSELRGRLVELLQENDPTLSRALKVCSTRLTKLLDVDLLETDLHLPLAYALAWLRVSGGNSVLAPWVRHQFPRRRATDRRATRHTLRPIGLRLLLHDARSTA